MFGSAAAEAAGLQESPCPQPEMRAVDAVIIGVLAIALVVTMLAVRHYRNALLEVRSQDGSPDAPGDVAALLARPAAEVPHTPFTARDPETPVVAAVMPDTADVSPQVFLSYATRDRETARTLAAALMKKGWNIWWDRTIPPGQSFDEVIEAALGASRCVIVLWSKASVTSDWVKVEAADALRRRILIPAVLDDVAIPLEFRRVQAASLVDWDGSLMHPGFELLAGSIARMLGPRASREQNSRP